MSKRSPLLARLKALVRSPLGRRNLWITAVYSLFFGPVMAYSVGRFGFPMLGLQPPEGWLFGSCGSSGSVGMLAVRSPAGCLASSFIAIIVLFGVICLMWIFGAARMSEQRFQEILQWRRKRFTFRRSKRKR